MVDSQDVDKVFDRVATPDERGESSKHKRKQGPTEMKEITRVRSEGRRLVIEYNELGQPIEKNSLQGKKKRNQHKYNYQTSRKGYAKHVEELKASSSHPIGLSIVWKQARIDRKRQIPDKETKKVVNLIDELIATETTDHALGEKDILTQALGGKDRPGILRGTSSIEGDENSNEFDDISDDLESHKDIEDVA
ncbi:uncharacterized protein E5676_scaffold68G00010 [Cucumis melo var. makuwa]|uniref:Uncharacterized protein n=1 Tax=Cucumis melo var. makuwa TaxID=1194695 RepID=A0A5D3BY76_CUCMM|nr:uncharacterized protein E5676_scaffold68G00010 [Cucumis melo var. makuwa]